MTRVVLWAMLPVDLVLLLWVWAGRLVFGVGGWFLLILLPVVVLLGVGLLVASILAFSQDGRPKALTHPQAWAQLVTWTGMLGAGAFMPDFGDTDDSVRSLLTQLFGYSDGLISASLTLAAAFGVVTVTGFVALFVLLVVARRSPGAAPEDLVAAGP